MERGNQWIAKSQSEVASFFDVSTDAVAKWRRKGMPGRRGQYDLAEIYRWREGRRQAAERKTDPEDPRRQLEWVALEAAKFELEAKRTERERSVMSREHHEALVLRTMTALRSHIGQLPVTLGVELQADEGEQRTIRENCEAALQSVLEELKPADYEKNGRR